MGKLLGFNQVRVTVSRSMLNLTNFLHNVGPDCRAFFIGY